MAIKIIRKHTNSQYANVLLKSNTLTYDYKMNDLIKNIQRIMAEKQWNNYDLEKYSGVPQPTIFRILNGKHKDPRTSTIKKIAEALGVNEFELRGYTHPVNENKTDQIIVEDKQALSPRQKAFLELIDSLPTVEQEKLMRELEEKERYFNEIYEDFISKKAS